MGEKPVRISAEDFLQMGRPAPLSEDMEESPATAPREPRVISQEEFLSMSPRQAPTVTQSVADVPAAPKAFLDLDKIKEEYARPLIKEDFLKDDRLQELVIQNLEARFSPNIGAIRKAGTAVKAVSGAAIGGLNKDYRNMPFEDVFEAWQNYQRSFAGGQSVTTAAEIAYSSGLDDTLLQKLGAGYLLFDSMDNAFTGEGSWSEMGDAVRDYLSAVVWDPTTLLSFGIGKALSGGATKATTSIARKGMIDAYRRGIQSNLGQGAVKNAVGKAAAAAPFMVPDLVQNVGLDIAYQQQLIKTGAQDEYSVAQTALAAAATMAIPAIAGGISLLGSLRKSDALKDTVVGYTKIEAQMLRPGADEAWKAVEKVVNKEGLDDALRANFSKTDKFLDWENAKVVAKNVINEKGERLTDDELMNAFENFFWFGEKASPKKSGINLFNKSGKEYSGGYYNILKDNGFVIHADMLENNTISGVYGQAVKFLSDDVVESAIKTFENTTGRKLNLDYTAEGLSAHIIGRSSEAGKALQIKSRLATLEKSGLTGSKLAQAASGKLKLDEKKWGQFGLSVYKRLITSHLSTTGANLKGFAQIVSLNTAADLLSSATYATQFAAAKAFGSPEQVARYGNKAWGSLMAPLRRGVSVLSPDLEFSNAMKILEASPETIQKLYREVGADGGIREALEAFNLQGNLGAKVVDKVTSGAQTLTLVRLQDEMTKTWAFGTNFDTALMKEFGLTPSQFWKQENLTAIMAGPKYKNVLDIAARKTLRETMSVNWSSLPANGMFRSAASMIEYVTNKTPVGYVVPFGSFMNTTIATLGDLSGANALRRTAAETGKALGLKVKIDYTDGDFAELLGKAAVGWSVVGFGVPAALERIQNGLGYNMEMDDTGEVKDIRYDYPKSTFNLLSQIVAHAYVGEEGIKNVGDLLEQISNGERDFSLRQVPDELKEELLVQSGGQALRDLDGLLKGIKDTLISSMDESGVEGPLDVGQSIAAVLGTILQRPIQGITRPLDPVNITVGMLRGGNLNPDLKQGPEFVSEAMKYVNQIFPSVTKVDELPMKADPLKGTDYTVDVGKQILGNRTRNAPNLAERMFYSAGKESWRAIRFGGPAEVKNYMDTLVAPIFEAEAVRALKNNPNYFDKSTTTEQRNRILKQMETNARASVKKVIETGGLPRTLDFVRKISESDKKRVRLIKDFLGYDGEVEDIAKEEGGFEKLMKLDFFLRNYDDIFFGDLKLD